MHNLRRIAAGLRGEYLEPEPTPEPEEEEGAQGEQAWKGNKTKGRKTTFTDPQAGTVEVEWQDKEAYEREQGEIEVGELGKRTNVVQDGGEEPDVEVTGDKRKGGDEKLDKEARKKAKKERDAQRKKENEKKRKDKA